eukprot:m.19332 g.19332  ORF g.19332 m.19332 type:complete len:320 (-) comp12421_c0_seq1:133-1092(-)
MNSEWIPDFPTVMRVVGSRQQNDVDTQDKAVLKAFSAVDDCYPCDMATALGLLDGMHVSPEIETYRQALMQSFKHKLKGEADNTLRKKMDSDPGSKKAKEMYLNFKMAITWSQVAQAFKVLSSSRPDGRQDREECENPYGFAVAHRFRMHHQTGMAPDFDEDVEESDKNKVSESLCDAYLLVDMLDHFEESLKTAISEMNNDAFWKLHCRKVQHLGAVQRLASTSAEFSRYMASMYRQYGTSAMGHVTKLLENLQTTNQVFGSTLMLEPSSTAETEIPKTPTAANSGTTDTHTLFPENTTTASSENTHAATATPVIDAN